MAAVGGEATNPASIPAATANSAQERQRVSRARRLVRWAGQPAAGFEISAAQIDYRTLGFGGRTNARIIGVLNVNAPNRSARGAADAAGTSARDDRTARPSAHNMLLHLLTAGFGHSCKHTEIATDRAADEVRSRPQPQDRQDAGHHLPASIGGKSAALSRRPIATLAPLWGSLGDRFWSTQRPKAIRTTACLRHYPPILSRF